MISTTEKHQERIDGPGLLFEWGLKSLLFAAFFELVLYRLVSRLGMHLGKLAEKYEAVRIGFRTLSSLGFVLLNMTAILVFLILGILLVQKIRTKLWVGEWDKFVIPLAALLVACTVGYLLFPPVMVGTIVYNVLAFGLLVFLVLEYWATHRVFSQRLMVGTFFLGISGWLYYQTMSTTYGWLNIFDAPPLVHEGNRLGEALMVLSSILVFWAYGTTSIITKNKQQRRWGLTLLISGGSAFLALLFLDFFLSLWNPEVAKEVRKAGEGIGWIFQMGMGYTFYLPFAFYVLGFTCWAYTVIKLVLIGRLAGYGLGLMFMAGYALQLSHLTLMVVLGLMLLNIDKRGTLGKLRKKAQEGLVYQPNRPIYGQTQ
ncbi:MAG: hypothetical protein H0W49_00020 [Nitrospirales bacterium]|nr:hypothetical protein [Nitrospirales bacterium]